MPPPPATTPEESASVVSLQNRMGTPVEDAELTAEQLPQRWAADASITGPPLASRARTSPLQPLLTPASRPFAVLGDELYSALCAEELQLARSVSRLSLVGEVKEKQPPPNAMLVPSRSQSGRDTWPYEQLRTGVAWPPGVGADERERWLSNAEFEAVLGVSRKAWEKMPLWKRSTIRREADIF